MPEHDDSHQAEADAQTLQDITRPGLEAVMPPTSAYGGER